MGKYKVKAVKNGVQLRIPGQRGMPPPTWSLQIVTEGSANKLYIQTWLWFFNVIYTTPAQKARKWMTKEEAEEFAKSRKELELVP